jgi:hypothetical protein
MQDKLLEYAIGLLDGEDATVIDAALAADMELQNQLDLIRLALAPLEVLRRELDAPHGLAVRTCVRIREIPQCQER